MIKREKGRKGGRGRREREGERGNKFINYQYQKQNTVISVDPMDNKKINMYYKQLYSYKFDNFDERDQLYERHKIPKLTQEKYII